MLMLKVLCCRDTYPDDSNYPSVIIKRAEYIIDPTMPWQALLQLLAAGQLRLDIRLRNQKCSLPFPPSRYISLAISFIISIGILSPA